MQPLEVAGVPVEIEPLVTHTNDLLLRLDASLAAQRRFIGHAAHQLRTPLSGLRLESELMLARPLRTDDARAGRAHQGGQRPHDPPGPAIVGAGARRSQCPASRQLRARRPVRMGAVERGRVVSPAREARHELDLVAPDTPIWIDADPLLLAELLGNLIDNALRYGNETGRIVLIVGANPPSLTVEDDGPGIPPEERDRVFEAFYRSPTATAGGSGLGLAIVREIAHAHGAWWRLTSRPIFPERDCPSCSPAAREPNSLGKNPHHEPGHGPRS